MSNFSQKQKVSPADTHAIGIQMLTDPSLALLLLSIIDRNSLPPISLTASISTQLVAAEQLISNLIVSLRNVVSCKVLFHSFNNQRRFSLFDRI